MLPPFHLSLLCSCLALLACGGGSVSSGPSSGTSTPPVTVPAGPQSQWVSFDSQGKLVYKTLAAGDRILDFSTAGYCGGGVTLPTVPAVTTVSPSGGDDTKAIQAALDAVSARTAVNGIRGAVLLQAGTFTCSSPLTIPTSGVVLRGSGSGANGTILHMTGSPFTCIQLQGAQSLHTTGSPIAFSDAYVPSGVASLNLANTAGLSVGDTILLARPVTSAWIHFMGMDTLVRNNAPETWLAAGSTITTLRSITSISGNRVNLDQQTTDSFDATYLNPPGGNLAKVTIGGLLSEVGVEQLHIVSPPQPVNFDTPGLVVNSAISMDDLVDGWLSDVVADDTVDSVSLGSHARRITLDHVSVTHTVATSGSAKPMDFTVYGSQVLMNQCTVTGDRLFYFVTGSRTVGPNVLLNCTFKGDGWLQPHQRWATGLLVDGCQVPTGGIDFINRGYYGSGHGWTIGWSVLWNCVAHEFTVQMPPGSANWAIGCSGARQLTGTPGGSSANLPEGIYDSHGIPVVPKSLYLRQLYERSGASALAAIGYAGAEKQ